MPFLTLTTVGGMPVEVNSDLIFSMGKQAVSFAADETRVKTFLGDLCREFAKAVNYIDTRQTRYWFTVSVKPSAFSRTRTAEVRTEGFSVPDCTCLVAALPKMKRDVSRTDGEGMTTWETTHETVYLFVTQTPEMIKEAIAKNEPDLHSKTIGTHAQRIDAAYATWFSSIRSRIITQCGIKMGAPQLAAA